MPVVTAQYTLSNVTAAKVVSAEVMQQTAIIHNGDHQNSHIIYLGNSGVTASNGMHLDVDSTITIPLDPGSELWAISSNNGTLLTKLVIKQD
jgi:hypothetical protein